MNKTANEYNNVVTEFTSENGLEYSGGDDGDRAKNVRKTDHGVGGVILLFHL